MAVLLFSHAGLGLRVVTYEYAYVLRLGCRARRKLIGLSSLLLESAPQLVIQLLIALNGKGANTLTYISLSMVPASLSHVHLSALGCVFLCLLCAHGCPLPMLVHSRPRASCSACCSGCCCTASRARRPTTQRSSWSPTRPLLLLEARVPKWDPPRSRDSSSRWSWRPVVVAWAASVAVRATGAAELGTSAFLAVSFVMCVLFSFPDFVALFVLLCFGLSFP